MDHLAVLDTSHDAPSSPVCGSCMKPVTGSGSTLRHVGEARRRRVLPARQDKAAFERAELLAARALNELTWTPHTTNADRAAAMVEAIYEAGLLAPRPRIVQPRSTTPRHPRTKASA